jgi:tRNA(fMet)-specific endonuclease VapC
MDRAEPLYMLDTNILSYLMDPQARAQRLYCEERFSALRGRIAISVLVQAEVFAGLEKNPSPRKELRLRELMRRIRVEYPGPDLWFSDLFACIKASLERRGTPQEKFDMAIAAHAMALGATLVSDDKALSRIEGLKLETWDVAEVAHRRRSPGVAESAAAYLRRRAVADFGPALPPAGLMTCWAGARYGAAHAR